MEIYDVWKLNVYYLFFWGNSKSSIEINCKYGGVTET